MSAVKRKDPEVTFKSEFFDDLYELEANNFWFRSRNALIIWAFGKYFQNVGSFLEIGCGTGYVLNGIRSAFPNLKLSGSELFAEGLKFAKVRLKDVELIELDAKMLDEKDSYDVIGAFDVIEHIQEDELVLRQLHKACKSGILITVPQHMFLWSAIDDYSCHKRRYSRSELERKVEDAGFEIAYIGSFISLLLPILFVSRFQKKRLEEKDLMNELRLPKPINAVLEMVLSFERLLIKNGINFPAGGSLLLCARKVRR